MRRFRIPAIILIFVLLFPPLPCNALQVDPYTIRVGYYDHTSIVSKNNKQYTDYGTAYLEKLSQYTNWNVTYISGSLENCKKWLLNGTIDVMFLSENDNEYVSTTEADQPFIKSSDNNLAQESSYSEVKSDAPFAFLPLPVAEEYGVLYALAVRGDILYDDYVKFEALKIGVLKDTPYEKMLDAYAHEHQLRLNKVYFDTADEMNNALSFGKIDVAASGSLGNFKGGIKIVSRYGYQRIHLVTREEDSSIYTSLKQATQQLFFNEPDLMQSLYQKYYANTSICNVAFTPEEDAYIKSSDALTMVCDPASKPIEYFSGNTYKGVYANILNMISKKSGLKFDYVKTKSFDDSLTLIRNGQADLISSMHPSSAIESDYGIYLTSPYTNSKYVITSKKGADLTAYTGLTVAVNRVYPGTSYWIEENYPNWIIQYYNSIQECIEAVLGDKADVSIQNSESFNRFLSNSFYTGNLSSISMLDISIPVSIGVNQQLSPLLFSILNKSIRAINPQYVDWYIFTGTASEIDKMTILDYIKKHYILILSVLTILFGLILYVSSNKRKRLLVLAETDLLTQLYNKISIENHIESCLKLESDYKHALFLIDIDNFKTINDTFGHRTGDRILRETAIVLKSLFSADDIVGRLGGDEFGVFIRTFDSNDDLKQKALEISVALHKICVDEGSNHLVTASIGIAIFPDNGLTVETLSGCADQAMYASKKSGRDTYTFYKSTLAGKSN